MITVVVVIHLLIAVSLIILILLQKNEGNASGGGFSSSSVTAMMQPRSRPNPLSRATTILGITFFVTSVGLALLAKQNGPAPSILAEPVSGAKAPKVDEIQTPVATPAVPGETPAPTNAQPAAPSVPPAAPPAPKD